MRIVVSWLPRVSRSRRSRSPRSAGPHRRRRPAPRPGRRPRRRTARRWHAGPVDRRLGAVAMTPVDARGWGWQVKASVTPDYAAAVLQQGQGAAVPGQAGHQLHGVGLQPGAVLRSRKHFDFIWFEMQHSTMSWDEVRRMMLTCPGVDGAAPMVRMPDALESSIQKATDIGAVGIIVPTVDDALEARDAARFSRYPPVGRRSSGGGSFGQMWPGVNYRATINDNMLVTVMIETLEGVANAEEIAATAGVDVVILGNNDLSALLRLAAERSALSGCADQGPQRGAQVRQVLRQRRAAVSERLCRQRRHAHGAGRPGTRWMAAARARRRRRPWRHAGAGRTRSRRERTRRTRAGHRPAGRCAADDPGPGRPRPLGRRRIDASHAPPHRRNPRPGVRHARRTAIAAGAVLRSRRLHR